MSAGRPVPSPLGELSPAPGVPPGGCTSSPAPAAGGAASSLSRLTPSVCSSINGGGFTYSIEDGAERSQGERGGVRCAGSTRNVGSCNSRGPGRHVAPVRAGRRVCWSKCIGSLGTGALGKALSFGGRVSWLPRAHSGSQKLQARGCRDRQVSPGTCKAISQPDSRGQAEVALNLSAALEAVGWSLLAGRTPVSFLLKIWRPRDSPPVPPLPLPPLSATFW